MSNSLFILYHLGLGDNIICNGMVNYLSEYYDEITLPVLEPYLNTLKWLYFNNKKVNFCVVSNNVQEVHNKAKESGKNLLKIGLYNEESWAKKPQEHVMRWDNYLYVQANLDFELSWDYFKCPSSVKTWEYFRDKYNIQDEFCLIHEDVSRGMIIDRNRINKNLDIFCVEKEKTPVFFENMPLLYKAKELHCIESSFILFIDRLNDLDINEKGFMHQYVRCGKAGSMENPSTIKKNWIIL